MVGLFRLVLAGVYFIMERRVMLTVTRPAEQT
jgi:hypothetical protein